MEDLTAITGESGILTRNLTLDECPWLDKEMSKGTVVFRYYGPDWGSISPKGIAICIEPNEFPFMEVPIDSVEWDK